MEMLCGTRLTTLTSSVVARPLRSSQDLGTGTPWRQLEWSLDACLCNSTWDDVFVKSFFRIIRTMLYINTGIP